MSEEEIRCCINIATLDRELPYKKLLKEMKKGYLVDMCYELLKEHLALLAIQNILVTKQKVKGLTNQLLNIQEQSCLDIVNKALESDGNE